MCRACGRALRQKRKHFFFEKKKQTTFSPAAPSPCVKPRQPTDKGFLVLFFKKERLSSARAPHAAN
jgi:hypothetical protein